MDVANILLIIILLLVVIFFLSKMFLVTNIIYDKMCNAATTPDGDSLQQNTSGVFGSSTNVIFNNDFLENSTSNFMLSVWFYIDNWGNKISQEKNILFMSDKNDAITVPDLQQTLQGVSSSVTMSSTPGGALKNVNICLDKYENNLFIDIESYLSSTSAIVDGSSNYTRYIVKNIPVQKWNCLTLSVDTRTLDVYLDGKLRNSFILNGVYKNELDSNGKKNIYLGNIDNDKSVGFEGFITRVRYEPNSINPEQAYKIYREGINQSLAQSMFNKYRLKVSFLEYNKERGSFTI